MTRTLYVIQHREWSGGETALAPVIRADPDALVACPSGTPTEEFVRGLGAATVDLPFRSLRHSGGTAELVRSMGRGLASVRDLRRIVRANPDRRLVYGTTIRPDLLASLACVGLPARVVWCVTDRLPPRPLRWAVRALAWLGARRILCHSEFIARDIVGRSPRLRRVTRVAHPGVDPRRFDPGGARPGEPLAATVGFISPVKRTDLAIDIAAIVAARHPGFVLRVIGAAQFRDEDFALERELKARVAADETLSAAVEFTGRIVDVPGALAGAGALLHCRPDEPFGMVMAEAMAQGLPVVAPASGGALEIVEDGVTGLLYEPGDAQHAADCLLSLISDREAAAEMGQAGRARVLERFAAARLVAETQKLFAEALGEAPAVSA